MAYANISSYLEGLLLKQILKDVPFDVAPVYMGLHTADPGNTGASEVSGGSYARVLIPSANWSNPVVVALGSECQNDVEVAIVCPACTVTYISFWSSESPSNFLWSAPLLVPAVLSAGQTFRLAPGLLKARMK